VNDRSKYRVSDIGTFEDIGYWSSPPIRSDTLTISCFGRQSADRRQPKRLQMLLRPPPCCGWEGVGVDTGHVRLISALYRAGRNHSAIERPQTQWRRCMALVGFNCSLTDCAGRAPRSSDWRKQGCPRQSRPSTQYRAANGGGATAVGRGCAWGEQARWSGATEVGW